MIPWNENLVGVGEVRQPRIEVGGYHTAGEHRCVPGVDENRLPSDRMHIRLTVQLVRSAASTRVSDFGHGWSE
jgi:hypothetical protein